jgi:4-diphosphocytidyl-2-C-methyl-D-erythritol kinase
VKAPAKINLQLSVGAPRSDGFHEVATVYQAVALFDEVSVSSVIPGSGVSIEITGDEVGGLSADETNLAYRAVTSLAKKLKVKPDCHIEVTKSIPVAAGLAGGSADAAAALVGANALWGNPFSKEQLAALAASLGSDVPFALRGGTAVGRGRGEVLAPTLCRGEFAWVLAFVDGQIPTPESYRLLDETRTLHQIAEIDEQVLNALASGDAVALGKALSNDLQEVAIRLKPNIASLLEYGLQEGALGGLVSGSGPTCIFLARDNDHAIDLAVRLSGGAVCRSVRRAIGPAPGAKVENTSS